MNMITDKLPRETLSLLAICLGGLMIIILAGIVPLHRAITNIDEEIKREGYKIDEQKDFAPLYKAFHDRIAKGAKTVSSELIIPRTEKLPREQVQNLNRVMRDLSARAGMTTVSVSPQINTTDITNSVSVHHIIRGSYISFRKYLLYLGQLPYYEKIDAIKIEETATGLEYSIKISVIVA